MPGRPRVSLPNVSHPMIQQVNNRSQTQGPVIPLFQLSNRLKSTDGRFSSPGFANR